MEIQLIEFRDGKTYINLKVQPDFIKTNNIQGFKEAILQLLPSLRNHQCYNENNHSFERELENTDLAHVFEHVLLEIISRKENYLRNIKGFTSWDWQKTPRHTYKIEIHHRDKQLILESLAIALNIFRRCLPQLKTRERSGNARCLFQGSN